MDFSFILLTWNSEKYIERCLYSLLSVPEESSFSFEILIVDNGSTDGTPQILKEFGRKYNQIAPIFLERNMGTTYTRNLAVRKAMGNHLVIMDSDVEASWNSIIRLRTVLENRPDAGIAVPRLIYPDGRTQKSTDRFPTLPSKLLRCFFLRQIENREAEAPSNEPVEIDYAISAFWMLKRKLLKEIGGFDEAIFYAPEDVDYCLRVWQKGYRVIMDPECIAVHHTQEASRGLRLNRLTIEHIKGLAFYFRKHRYLMRRPARNLRTTSQCP